MHNRFCLDLHQLRKILNDLRENLTKSVANADAIWMDAFSSIVGKKVTKHSIPEITAFDVQNIILMLSLTGGDAPWEFYHAVSSLVANVPEIISEVITQNINFTTDYDFEIIRLAPNGHWQIAWIIDDAKVNDSAVVLDWHIPSVNIHAPVVPYAILDHIASCVALLRQGLVLPAASIISVILEAALWDALDGKGVPQYKAEKIYMPVYWHFRKLSNQFTVSIEGADKDVKDLIIPSELADKSYNDITFEISKASFENSDKTINLYMKVNNEIVDYLSTSQIKSEEQVPIRGLSAAFQQARKKDLECLKVISKDFDGILTSLRNNLIHLPSQGNFREPISIPGGGVIRGVEDLKKNNMFVYQLLYLVVNIVRSVYLEKGHAMVNP
ncbi:hypothetical protein [Ktedonospora formicarum]|uniref:Uncharacterized protein n=1 Tax=Ktedonospora formicarum TaxID=2778364 RepID=A0A8J3I8J1_9CHLR|nr:hypothetical protein [Ktedonospora formicarum]GHO49178.1 hypothetical protein KSX_73410 [Ktedonospora formicarum]